jgi:GDPmannose 4,6-dehydratase
MWLMLQQDKHDDYAIATGETRSVREFCELAFRSIGLYYRDHVVVRPMLRPTEVGLLMGNASRAKSKIGWKVETRFGDLVRIMVDADLDLLLRRSGKRGKRKCLSPPTRQSCTPFDVCGQ